jgi:hypothetical protein
VGNTLLDKVRVEKSFPPHNKNIDIADIPVAPPRERDSWLMQEFVRLNYSGDDLRRLNRVRVHQEVLFLSDVMDARGRAIDRRYLTPQPMEETWSTLSFPNEQPARRDFQLWQSAILSIRALGGHRVAYTSARLFGKDTKYGRGDMT